MNKIQDKIEEILTRDTHYSPMSKAKLDLQVKELSQLITTQREEAFKNFVEYCEFNDLNKLVDKRDSTGNWYGLRELVTEWLSK